MGSKADHIISIIQNRKLSLEYLYKIKIKSYCQNTKSKLSYLLFFRLMKNQIRYSNFDFTAVLLSNLTEAVALQISEIILTKVKIEHPV